MEILFLYYIVKYMPYNNNNNEKIENLITQFDLIQ